MTPLEIQAAADAFMAAWWAGFQVAAIPMAAVLAVRVILSLLD